MSEDRIVIPRLLRDVGPVDTFVLRVVGDSMEDEGIHEGDYVIIERRRDARPGEMVVALVVNAAGEAEATLKRYYSEGEVVRLQPLKASLPPVRLPAEKVSVQGIAVGMLRKF